MYNVQCARRTVYNAECTMYIIQIKIFVVEKTLFKLKYLLKKIYNLQFNVRIHFSQKIHPNGFISKKKLFGHNININAV